MDNTYYIGIDISSKTIDVAIHTNTKKKAPYKQFNNDPQGHKELLKWINKPTKALHITMEATNIYWEELAYFLVSKNIKVSVVNPKRIKGYANSLNLRNKTDKIDAILIARYCAKEQPGAWEAPNANERSLLLKLRQLEHLKKCLTAEKTRRSMLKESFSLESCQRTIDFLVDEIKLVEKSVNELIKSDDKLSANAKLLRSIPAIGASSVPWLLAYLGDGSRFDNSKQATCFAGLTPMIHQSGTSVNGKPRISKIGHSEIRKILFMPAMAFSFGRFKDRVYAPFVQRLLARGKSKSLIITALMRKLLSIAQGVLKSQKPFDESLHNV